jgi:hypothetical protein
LSGLNVVSIKAGSKTPDTPCSRPLKFSVVHPAFELFKPRYIEKSTIIKENGTEE